MNKAWHRYLLVLTLLAPALLLVAGPANAVDSIIDVTTNADELPADMDNGACSLREAVAASNNDSVVDSCVATGADTMGGDAIDLDPGTAYALSNGTLEFTQTATLNGNSTPAQPVSVQGGTQRIFQVTGSITVNFNDLLVTGASCSTFCDGAGVNVPMGATAHFNKVVFLNNDAGTAGLGGAIYNAGTATLTDSSVGPGVRSLFENTSGGGGGIHNSGTMTVTRSTVGGNRSFSDGAGIWNSSGTLTLVNSTISGNDAGTSGGGIYSPGNAGSVSSYFSTITDNKADYVGSGDPATGVGGGIAQSGSGTVTLIATILAGNVDETSAQFAPDCSGTITSGDQNLLGTNENCTFSPQSGDAYGNPTPIDPLLGNLQDNGGTTFTHLPAAGSPAVNGSHGTNCPGPSASNLTIDQRGLTRIQGSHCDTGAVERDLTPPTSPNLSQPNAKWQPDRAVGVDWDASSDAVSPPGGTIMYEPHLRQIRYSQTAYENVGPSSLVATTDTELFVPAGRTACFTVTAQDGDGNESAPSNEKCTSVPVDDRGLKRRGKWKEGSGDEYYLDTFLKTRKQGAKLLLKNIKEAEQLALVATKCPKCGKVKVIMAGELLKKVSLKRPSEKNNIFINLEALPNSADTGTAKIVVISDGKKVVIEGLGVRKAP